MMKTLHVLNGDATAHPFASAGLPGDVAIWREMLSEGPLLAVPKSDEELWSSAPELAGRSVRQPDSRWGLL